MASLNDLLAKARLTPPSAILSPDVRNNAVTQFRSTTNQIRNIPASILDASAAKLQGAVGNAVQTGLSDVRGAVVQALSGDFSGALTTIAQGPQDVLGMIEASFGSNTSGTPNPFLANGAPVNTLQGALGRSDPLMSFQWYCDLPTVTPIGGAPANLSWEYVEEATPNFRVFEVQSMHFQGRNRNIVGKYSVDPLRLNFYADVSNTALLYLQAWNGAVLRPFDESQASSMGGGFGRPSDYMKPINLYLFDPTKALVFNLSYTECWPTSTEGLHLDSGSSTRLTFNVSFSVGDVFIQALKINNNLSGQFLLNTITNNLLSGIL